MPHHTPVQDLDPAARTAALEHGAADFLSKDALGEGSTSSGWLPVPRATEASR